MVWNQINNDFHANCSEGEYNQCPYVPQGACYTMLEQELAVAMGRPNKSSWVNILTLKIEQLHVFWNIAQ